MPCYSIQKTKVAIGQVNLERLKAVAEKEGWTVFPTTTGLTLMRGATRLELKPGNVQALVTGPAEPVSALKRSYAARTVLEAARRHGWRLQHQKTEGNTVHLKIGR